MEQAELLAVAEAVLEWARSDGNHGGNPYCHRFVQLAEDAVRKVRTEGAAVEASCQALLRGVRKRSKKSQQTA